MNPKRLLTAIMAVAISVSAVSCGEGKEPKPGSTTKITLGFGKYYSAKGTVKNPVWTAGVQAGAIDVTKGKCAVAKALGSGESTAIFLFPLEGAAAKDRLACFYPADAATFESGKIAMTVDPVQTGKEQQPAQLGIGEVPASSYAGANINMKTMPCLVLATVPQGDYSIAKATLSSIGGEKLSGKVLIDPETLQAKAYGSGVTVELANPLDCRAENQVIPIYVAPVHLSKGYTITFTTTEGNTFTAKIEQDTEFKMGEKVETDPAACEARKLIACGSDKVYLFDAAIAQAEGRYNNALLWSWTSTAFPFGSKSDHIDDCKVVSGGKQFLVTCSNGKSWCAVVNYPEGDVAYYVTDATNAHSAELLPGDLLAVASSDGGDNVLLYDIKGGTSPIGSYPLTSAHGVVWSDSQRRLYAIGGTSVQIYKLSGKSLILDRTLSSTGYVGGLHDATLAAPDMIIMGGSNNGGHSAALLNLSTSKFTAVTHFNGITGIKSVNYNPDTGELYYTYAASGTSEGGYDWSSHKLRYTDDITRMISGDGASSSSTWRYLWVDDINMYKVRVYNW